jgi:hypothetical protein
VITADVAFHDFHGIAEGQQVFALGGGKVVEHTHGFTPPHQLLDNVGTDEPRAACYEECGHLFAYLL